MADISKGKRSLGRRSSILKTALADIDVNVTEKKEKKKRHSKRVSFAETCCVKEFPRDSPQFLKGLEHKDGNTSGDGSLLDPNPGNENVAAQPQPSADENGVQDRPGGSSFILDEGETTFVSGMGTVPAGYYESTRNLDRFDIGIFGESEGLDISEIAQGDNSVFVPGPCLIDIPVGQPADVQKIGPAMPDNRAAHYQVPVSGQQDDSMGRKQLQDDNNKTVLFDNDDGGSMEITLCNVSLGKPSPPSPPKMSARDFFSNFLGADSGRVFGVRQVREERTLLVATSERDGNTMEFTQNLSQHPITSTVSSSYRPISGPVSVTEERTIVFGNLDTSDDMNLTRNLSPLNMSTVKPAPSAKSFLASLRGEAPSSASIAALKSSDLSPLNAKAVRPSAVSFLASPSSSGAAAVKSVAFQPAQAASTEKVSTVSFAQLRSSTAVVDDELEQREEGDMTVTMEMTGCLVETAPGNVYRLPSSKTPFTTASSNLQTSFSSVAGNVQQGTSKPTFVSTFSAVVGPTPQAVNPLQPSTQQKSLSVSFMEDDMVETTDLSGCVESTRQLLLDANSSAIQRGLSTINEMSGHNSSASRSANRSALVDITERYSISPPPVSQASMLASNSQASAADVSQSVRNASGLNQSGGVEAGNSGVGSQVVVASGGPSDRNVWIARARTPLTSASTVLQQTPTRTPLTPLPQSAPPVLRVGQERSISQTEPATSLSQSLIANPDSLLSQNAVLKLNQRSAATPTRTPLMPITRTDPTTAQVATVESTVTPSRGPFSVTQGQSVVPTSQAVEENKIAETQATVERNRGQVVQSPAHQVTTSKTAGDAWFDKIEERSRIYSNEETAAHMSLTGVSEMSETKADMSRIGERSRIYSNEETAAHMDLTGVSEMTKADMSRIEERSRIYRSEETAAHMSLTGVSEMAATKTDMSRIFGNEDTAAHMSLTGVSEMDATNMSRIGERSRIYNNEETAAHMSLTGVCEMTETNANMSLTCASLPGVAKTAKPEADVISADSRTLPLKFTAERSIVFKDEDSAGNMSLTCAANMNLTCAANISLNNSQKEGQLELKPTSVPQGMQPSSAQPAKSHSVDKSILFAPESTAANMSLTTAMADEVNSIEEDEEVTFNLKSNQTDVQMDVGEGGDIASQRSKLESPNKKPSLSGNVLLSTVNTVSLSKEEENEEEEDNNEEEGEGFGGRPTTLLEITGVIAMLQKKMETKSVQEKAECSKPLAASSSENLTRTSASLAANQQPAGMMSTSQPLIATSLHQQFPMLPSSSSSSQQLSAAKIGSSRKLQLTGESNFGQAFAFPNLLRNNLVTSMNCATNGKEMTAMNSVVSASTKRVMQPGAIVEGEPTVKIARFTSSGSRVHGSTSTQRDLLARSSLMSPMDVDDDVGMSASTSNRSITLSVPQSRMTTSYSQGSSRSVGNTSGSSTNSSKSSNNSNSSAIPDIFEETMPEVFPAINMSGLGAGSLSRSMNTTCMSAAHGTTSNTSLGKSFMERQGASDQPSDFLKACEQLGIKQFELKGCISRRSSGLLRPDFSCDSMADKLNLVMITQEECTAKQEFFNQMAAILRREESLSEELEENALTQIHRLNLIAEAEQSETVRQQIRSLLNASKAHTQTVWKTYKADALNSLAERIKAHQQTVLEDMADITNSAENMGMMAEKATQEIGQLESKLESLRGQMASRKRSTRYTQQQERVQQRKLELTTLAEKYEDAKSESERIDQRLLEVEGEKARINERFEQSRQMQLHLSAAHRKLATLHGLHCWRPIRVEDQRIILLVLCDAVQMTVTFSGLSSSAEQRVTNISAVSRVAEGTEKWAALAAELTVDALCEGSQRLVDTFGTRDQLPQLLDEVTRIVEDARDLGEEIQLASLRHRINIHSKRVTVDLWNVQKVLKVCLTTEIPTNSYPHDPLHWTVEIVMGDVSAPDVQKLIQEVGAGRRYFTRVVNAVQTLLR